MDLDTDHDTLTTALLAKESAKKENTNEVVTEPVPLPPPSSPSDDAELMSSEPYSLLYSLFKYSLYSITVDTMIRRNGI